MESLKRRSIFLLLIFLLKCFTKHFVILSRCLVNLLCLQMLMYMYIVFCPLWLVLPQVTKEYSKSSAWSFIRVCMDLEFNQKISLFFLLKDFIKFESIPGVDFSHFRAHISNLSNFGLNGQSCCTHNPYNSTKLHTNYYSHLWCWIMLLIIRDKCFLNL